MGYINKKIKDEFPDVAVIKSKSNNRLFAGRNMPSFVKDFIIKRFSNEEGVVDDSLVKAYLEAKMPDNYSALKSRLLAGERLNITVRFIVKTDLASGRTSFSIPDAQLHTDAYIAPELIAKEKDGLTDGEKWGNITLEYHEPEGRRKGYIQMTSFKSFAPYRIDIDYFLQARANFTIEEWVDVLIAAMEYAPDSFATREQKMEFISRLLPFVEPRLNMMELGPKGTGKSYVYNNLSKYGWVIGGGKISRAKMFYNKNNKQYGLMKYFDVVAIDEISTFGFIDEAEMQSIMKNYLESGTATVDNVSFQSSCGLSLMGNIPLKADKNPKDEAYYKALPGAFRESATMDRFHAFIEGWKLPRLDAGFVLQGWTLNTEYFSSVLHALRTMPEYGAIFEELVDYGVSCDIRDLKSVQRVTTAYCKLLFPHIKSLASLDHERWLEFKDMYRIYCLEPAVYRRSIVRKQCHLMDPEFKMEMPEFRIR